ncbi:unnamed protein product, partial [Protopolystoma xenopodis]
MDKEKFPTLDVAPLGTVSSASFNTSPATMSTGQTNALSNTSREKCTQTCKIRPPTSHDSAINKALFASQTPVSSSMTYQAGGSRFSPISASAACTQPPDHENWLSSALTQNPRYFT